MVQLVQRKAAGGRHRWGSLELASGADESPDEALSLPLGAGRLTRDWLPDDPPKPRQLKELRKYVRAQVADVASRLTRFGQPELSVATSKTLRQLAPDRRRTGEFRGLYAKRTLTRADLGTWLPKLAEMTAQQRTELPGVSLGRAHQLMAGAVVAEAAMDILGISGWRSAHGPCAKVSSSNAWTSCQ